jgi:hypothetical protein
MTKELTARLHFIAASLLDAKHMEEQAKKERLRVEAELWQAIAEELGEDTCPLGSSRTIKDDDFKLLVKRPLTYALDENAWEKLSPTLPELGQAAVELRPKLVEKAAKWIEENDAALWTRMSKAITVKAGKVAVSVSVIASDNDSTTEEA